MNRRVLIAGLVAAFALALPLEPATAAEPQAEGTNQTKWYNGPEGQMWYQVHIPPQQAAGKPLPVVVSLHGCTMSGYGLNNMRDLTNFNQVADEKGFIVVYPTQDVLRNLVGCWNAFEPAHQRRGKGEPGLVAGVTKKVVADLKADPKRVHVNGASSGAGLAVILGVTYPDVFATVTSVAGGEYSLNDVDPNDLDAVTPVDTAKRAWAEMGPRARPVPTLVVQGDQDTTVRPFLADRLVKHWAAIDDLALNSALDNDMDAVADSNVTVTTPGLKTYTHKSYVPRDGGPKLIEYVTVQGLEHKWPGPGTGALVDNTGPDLARIIWTFNATRTLP
ncbi:PHB depolymerase family esterase [Kribbella antibiotica]|uniref:PHB depolymerase family esterase n=1 Tax=Kribbella antibiotica TaxID=190195 RepID=A0A4R4ZUY0_9ACTN|nr:PHB depolymerase family esterase [Kribbella antibiotica]TDD62675.1 PHB depolymerase family esterase [Kribbella antibiotica]